LDKQESDAIRSRLLGLLEDEKRKVEIKWKEGDLAIVDNLALGHFASVGTQSPREKSGLRILHRTTISGTASPLALKLSAQSRKHQKPSNRS